MNDSGDILRVIDLEDISPNPIATRELHRARSAALIGLAIVVQGGIALIGAELARSLLVGNDKEGKSESLVVVIWAILLTIVSGALGIGLLLKSWDKQTSGS